MIIFAWLYLWKSLFQFKRKSRANWLAIKRSKDPSA